EAQREPFSEIEFRAEARASRDADGGLIVRDASAEREVEIESADAAAHPAELAVRERPDQVPEVEQARLVVRLFENELRIAAVERVRSVRVEARVLEARFEGEVLREVERVRAAEDVVRRIEIRRIPAAHERKLVAEGLHEEALLDAAIVAAADQLLFQLL